MSTPLTYSTEQRTEDENKAPALVVRDVTVDFPDGSSTVRALDNVSMSARAGTMTGIVGESGSGKSTLLSVAAGLVSPTKGSVQLAGEDISSADDKTRSKLRRENIGMIFQQPNLLGALTVRDQLVITDHIRGEKARTDRADELLAEVGLEGFGDRPMNKLSGGQRQRVNIARAVMNNPPVLLADEPTSALDKELSHQIMELLRQISDDYSIATLIVTHDRSLLEYMDHVVEVVDGKVAKTT